MLTGLSSVPETKTVLQVGQGIDSETKELIVGW
jgi:hypothetical protein